jgi:CPA1 family monovalent cation:H+ antiporter
MVISWSGMRGIVSLAAAMALPADFPFRDLILLTAFSVVLGTLVLQGLTLKWLLRKVALRDDDPVGKEVSLARAHALEAGLASFADDRSAIADAVRQEFTARLHPRPSVAAVTSAHGDLHRRAVGAARQAVLDLRAEQEIGDDAFHQVEEDLDWLEMAGGRS